MKLTKFKERNHKKTGIIVFTICCVLLVTVVFLYKSFAIFETNENKNIINGQVQDPGDLYFAFYVNNTLQKEMPTKESNLVLDEEKSYCGINGVKDENIQVSLNEDWEIKVSGVTKTRTKCNLYFVRGIFIMGHGVPIVENGDGLYEVNHEGISGTINDDGFSQTEYRYAGSNPKNYILFNNELWRIIGLVNVMTDDNTIEQRVKMIRNESIGFYSWDSSTSDINEGGGINEWSKSDLMKLLNPGYEEETSNNSLYWNGTSGNCYNGKENNTASCNFKEKGLSKLRNYIADDIIWNTGALESSAITVNNSYIYERSENKGNFCTNGGNWCNDKVERNHLWKGTYENPALIGIMYPSDVGYSTSKETGTECLNTEVLSNFSKCFFTSWLNVSQSQIWTMSPYKNLSTNRNVFSFYNSKMQTANASDSALVIPVLYLKTNVKILSGNGNHDSPFTLMQMIK